MISTRRDFVRTLFAASQGAVISQLLPGSLRAAPPKDELTFAVIGDWGRHGRPDQMEVATQMGIACKNAGARFVISLGDNFYDDGVKSVDDAHWQKSFEQVYTAPSLQVPWYVILGNHDYRGSSEAQLDYGKKDKRWIMPARYYTKVYPIDAATNVECFYIDTSPMMLEYKDDHRMTSVLTQDVPAQMKWLDAALARSTAQWKLVMGHHPIYSAGSAHGTKQELVDSLLPVLEHHGVQAYFAGHDHDLQHLQAGKIDFIVSGGGSEHRPVLPFVSESHFARGVSGFAMASISAKELRVSLIDNRGANLYSATITRGA